MADSPEQKSDSSTDQEIVEENKSSEDDEAKDKKYSKIYMQSKDKHYREIEDKETDNVNWQVFSTPSWEQLKLSTLEELANCDYIHNRQLAAKSILEDLQNAGSNREELQSIIGVMCKLSEDEESLVRSELVQHIPPIALFCQSHPSGLKQVIHQQLVPYTVKLLNDSQIAVRKLAQSALLVLLENNLIAQLQLSEWICPLIAQLATCESNIEEQRIGDVTLMSMMIDLVPKDISMKFFLEPYLALCCDQSFGIRTVCAMRFGTLCKIAGSETTEMTLLRSFVELCSDDLWGVRKACADVFVDVASVAYLHTRKETLAPIFLKLLNDTSRYVMLAAYQSLGGFIGCFADPAKTNFTEIISNGAKEDDLNSNLTLTSKPVFSEPYFCAKSKGFITSARRARRNIRSQHSLAVASKGSHVFLHIDNENVFNNFQFWRNPLPEVELDIDIDSCNTTNIHVRAIVPGSGSSSMCASEIKVCIASSKAPDSSTNSTNSAGEQNALPQLQVQTACIGTISSQCDAPDKSCAVFKEENFTLTENNLVPANEPNNTTEDNGSIRVVNASDANLKDDVIEKEMSPSDQDIVPEVILSKFISVVNQSQTTFSFREANDSNELIGYCAYSFPAVAYTLGKRYWPCIRSTCKKLSNNSKYAVRKTMASSLHELAAILGHDIIIQDLFLIFLEFLKDVDGVRLKLILHLRDFLQHLRPAYRSAFPPLLKNFSNLDDHLNWRFRCILAEQLALTLDLYSALYVFEYFLPVAAYLLKDCVSAVRIAATEFLSSIVWHLHQDETTRGQCTMLLEELDFAYSQSSKWIRRQTYVRVCEQIAKNRSIPMELYVEKTVPKLFAMATDFVPNVRLAVSKCIAMTLLPLGYVPIIQKVHKTLFLGVVNKLLEDGDRDVKYLIEMHKESLLC